MMKNKNKHWGYVFSWMFGMLFLLIGLVNLNVHATLSIALAFLGLVLLPPVNMAIDKQWKLDMNERTKNAFLIIFLITGGLILAGMCNWFYCITN